MSMGNLTLASMLGAIAGMMGDAKLSHLSGMSLMGVVTQKDIAKLNRQFIKIKK